MTTELATTLQVLVFPIWDKKKRVLKNHYKTQELICMLKLLDKTQQEMEIASTESYVRMRPLLVARLVSKLHRPPRSVLTWAGRLLTVFYEPLVKEAVLKGYLSGNYALSDIADRLHIPKFKKHIIDACNNNLTNKEFRRISHNFNKEKRCQKKTNNQQ